MRTTFLIAAAILAAGVSTVTAGNIDAPQTTDWSGFYVGGSLGYDWSSSTANYAGIDDEAYAPALAHGDIVSSNNLKTSGWFGGIQAGYNYQLGRAVLGTEVDLSHIAAHGSRTSPVISTNPAIVSTLTAQDQKLDWLSTVRARLGYLPTPNLMTYITGGLAIGRATASTSTSVLPAPGQGDCTTPGGSNLICSDGSSSHTMIGWTIGAGLESLIAEHWSIKAEYLYYDLGSMTDTTAINVGGRDPLDGQPGLISTTKYAGKIARVGLNYHF